MRFVLQTIRQGILYSGDFSASTGTVRNVSPVFTGSHPSTFWALASDYRRRRVYYSNFRRNYFGSYNVEVNKLCQHFFQFLLCHEMKSLFGNLFFGCTAFLSELHSHANCRCKCISTLLSF